MEQAETGYNLMPNPEHYYGFFNNKTHELSLIKVERCPDIEFDKLYWQPDTGFHGAMCMESWQFIYSNSSINVIGE